MSYAIPLLILAALWTAPLHDPGGPPSYRLDPDRVAWRSLRFEARKLIFKGEAEVDFEVVPSAAAGLDPRGDGALMPRGEKVARVTLESRFGKRHSTVEAHFDAADARALQLKKREGGRKRYQRVDRFTTGGVASDRRAPDDDERQLKPAGWSEREHYHTPWPATTRAGQTVTEPTSLFYLITSPALAAPGDRLETLVYSRRELYRLRIEVVGTTTVEVGYDEEKGGTTERREGEVEALEIEVRAAPVRSGARHDDFRFLGLEGDVTLLVDPETRLPFEVRGRIPPLGNVRVILRHAVLASGHTT